MTTPQKFRNKPVHPLTFPRAFLSAGLPDVYGELHGTSLDTSPLPHKQGNPLLVTDCQLSRLLLDSQRNKGQETSGERPIVKHAGAEPPRFTLSPPLKE